MFLFIYLFIYLFNSCLTYQFTCSLLVVLFFSYSANSNKPCNVIFFNFLSNLVYFILCFTLNSIELKFNFLSVGDIG